MREYFKMTSKTNSMHTFVISLSHEILRRKAILKKLNDIPGNFEFFDAIDGKKINLLEHIDYQGLKRRLCYGKDLTRGELGCFFSHRAVLEKIVKNKVAIALVLEDDVVLSGDFIIVLDRLINCSYPWEAVRFLGKPKITKMMQKKVIRLYNDYYLTRLSTSPGGAYAYLISYVGAKKLLKSMKKVSCPNDTIMGLPWKSGVDVLTVQPGIATWDKKFESAIGNQRYEKNKLIGWERTVYPVTRMLFKLREGALKKAFYFFGYLKDKRRKNE